MPKNEFMTPKAIANRIKSKGLQKLRWYCQMCHKQCRDEVSWSFISLVLKPNSCEILFVELVFSEWIQVPYNFRVPSKTTPFGG